MRVGFSGISVALLAVISCAERSAPNTCRQNTDGWSSLWVFCSCLLTSAGKRPVSLHSATGPTEVWPELHPRCSQAGIWRFYRGANIAALSYF